MFAGRRVVCWCQLEKGRREPAAATLKVFERLRGINWVLLGIFPVLVVWRMMAWADPVPRADLGWGIVLAIAAVLE